MSDRPDELSKKEASEGGEKPPLKSVREVVGPGGARPKPTRAAEEAGRGRDGRRSRGRGKRSKGRGQGGGAKKPTPVRTMAKAEAPPPITDPDTDEVTLHAGEDTWLVRVLGRSGGGESGAAPLLLLGFWPEISGDAAPAREALTVARTLASMSETALERAFDLSRASPTEPTGPRKPPRERRRRR